jgi:hypothetical protein
LTWATLRSYLEAYRFAAKLSDLDAALSEKLCRQSIDVARCIARWSAWDKAGAVEFLQSTEQLTRTLAAAAERDAKRKRPPVPATKFRDTILASSVRPLGGKPRSELSEHFVRLGYGDAQVMEFFPERQGRLCGLSMFEHQQGVSDEWIFRLQGEREVWIDAVVMATANHSIADGYRREARPLLFRALSLAVNRPLVIVPFPTLGARQEFLNGRPVMPFEDGTASNIPAANRAIRRASPTRQIILPGAALGVILATTAESLATHMFEE